MNYIKGILYNRLIITFTDKCQTLVGDSYPVFFKPGQVACNLYSGSTCRCTYGISQRSISRFTYPDTILFLLYCA